MHNYISCNHVRSLLIILQLIFDFNGKSSPLEYNEEIIVPVWYHNHCTSTIVINKKNQLLHFLICLYKNYRSNL